MAEKETRQLNVTLEEAKKWYKAGGTLAGLARQLYTKEELESVLPSQSWNEYEHRYYAEPWYIPVNSNKGLFHIPGNAFSTLEETEAFEALGRLLKLYKECVKDYKISKGGCKICRDYDNKVLTSYIGGVINPFCFPDTDKASEFLKTHKDLFEKAKMFI